MCVSRTVATTVIVVHFYVIYISYCFLFICIFLIISCVFFLSFLAFCFGRRSVAMHANGRLVAVQCAHLTIVAHKHSLLLLLLVISFNGFSVIVKYSFVLSLSQNERVYMTSGSFSTYLPMFFGM